MEIDVYKDELVQMSMYLTHSNRRYTRQKSLIFAWSYFFRMQRSRVTLTRVSTNQSLLILVESLFGIVQH